MKKHNVFAAVLITVTTIMGVISTRHSIASEAIANEKPVHAVTGPVLQGYQLIISTTNETFVSGQSFILTASIRNVSTNVLNLMRSSSWFNLYHIEVLQPNGTNALRTQAGKRMGVNVTTGETTRSVQDLLPGGHVEMPIYLNELFQMTEPGDYRITVTQMPWVDAEHPERYLRVPAGPLKIQIEKRSVKKGSVN